MHLTLCSLHMYDVYTCVYTHQCYHCVFSTCCNSILTPFVGMLLASERGRDRQSQESETVRERRERKEERRENYHAIIYMSDKSKQNVDVCRSA